MEFFRLVVAYWAVVTGAIESAQTVGNAALKTPHIACNVKTGLSGSRAAKLEEACLNAACSSMDIHGEL